ncbi:endo-1,4-beta-xylanase [Evansella tamaricis]|uniref:endo-1,4-beta-xylanase n=1 Tax=Evansella tamaricis TaxID=2069301 RepID=A0ABS6JHV5_9BACI|nr:endo-1,4-beta-xylanase [Evansella tamaricis]MBU9712965.1 endo-1,4-beta-xylanase [Evansella tamaricis]
MKRNGKVLVIGGIVLGILLITIYFFYQGNSTNSEQEINDLDQSQKQSDKAEDHDLNIIAHYDFEDNTFQGWVPRQANLEIIEGVSMTGSYSLLTTGRTESWQGPSIDVLPILEKSAVYEITLWVKRKNADESSNVKVSIETVVGGNQDWHTISETVVHDKEWTELTGEFSYVNEPSELLLYVESELENDEYYIDDILIKQTSAPDETPASTESIQTNFEDGTSEGWSPRIGEEALNVTDTDSKEGSYSLLTENRANPYSGPALEITNYMVRGGSYELSVWVKLAPEQQASEMRLSIQRGSGDTASYDTVSTHNNVTSEEWVELAATYDLAYDVNPITVYVETVEGTTPFFIDNFQLKPQATADILPIQHEIPALKEVFEDYFDMGAAVELNHLNGPHQEILDKHFNSIVAENVMKPETIQPTEGNFNWAQADAMFDYAEEKGKLVRFHTLVWHSQTPDWFFMDAVGDPMVVDGEILKPENLEENKALLLERMETHVRSVVERYKGRVDSWDVVNEVIDPNELDGFRKSEYYLITGTDFIHRAFEIVAEMDPDSKLFYNDYNSHQPAKRDFIYDMVVDMLNNGIRVDGIGHQTHINLEYPSIQYIRESIVKFADLGLDNQITELDIDIYTNDTEAFGSADEIPEEMLTLQAIRYQELFTVFRELGDHISNVTFWGIADDHSWLHNRPIPRRNAPFVFDEQLQAKESFWSIINLEHTP